MTDQLVVIDIKDLTIPWDKKGDPKVESVQVVLTAPGVTKIEANSVTNACPKFTFKDKMEFVFVTKENSDIDFEIFSTIKGKKASIGKLKAKWADLKPSCKFDKIPFTGTTKAAKKEIIMLLDVTKEPAFQAEKKFDKKDKLPVPLKTFNELQAAIEEKSKPMKFDKKVWDVTKYSFER